MHTPSLTQAEEGLFGVSACSLRLKWAAESKYSATQRADMVVAQSFGDLQYATVLLAPPADERAARSGRRTQG
jgi:hypothetical protein